MLGLFLKGVQHVYGSGKANGINGTEGVAIEIVDNLENARAAKSFEWFRVRRLPAQLRIPKRATDSPANLLGEVPQIFFAATDPAYRLAAYPFRPASFSSISMICQFRHRSQRMAIRARQASRRRRLRDRSQSAGVNRMPLPQEGTVGSNFKGPATLPLGKL